jgi:hypothetical protein
MSVKPRNQERRQFLVLYRDFLFRIINIEILSPGGEIRRLLIQFTAMLAAFSFVLAIWFVPMMSLSTMPRERLLVAASPLQEFLITSTMTMAGLFTLLVWNAILPDRRDCLILGPLPVPTRVIFLAKAAALSTALAISIIATNIFTGLSIPFLLGDMRTLFAWWLVMAVSGLFVACGLITIQGMLCGVLNYTSYMRISSWVQLIAFFGILGFFFLKPAHLAPSSWFFTLFRDLNRPSSGLTPASTHGLWSFGVVSALSCVTLSLAFVRDLRRIVEQPGIAPNDRRRPAGRLGSVLAAKVLPRSLDRAIVTFAARSVARSRQHRLLLAAYAGIGLAMALAYLRDLIYGSDLNRLSGRSGWRQPNTALLVAGLVLLFFCIVGVRAVFTMPMDLKANWIFRVTLVQPLNAYFVAIRKALYFLSAIPAWLAATVTYFAIWVWTSAAEHVLVLVLVGIVLAERALFRFDKIPFTCSYLPGKANIHVRVGAVGILFLLAASLGVQFEYWAMRRPLRFAISAIILGSLALWAGRRTASRPINQLRFEDLQPDELLTLNLVRLD